MRFVLSLAAVAAVAALTVQPAWACRGTAEFPEAEAKLQSSGLAQAEKTSPMERLQQAAKLHEQAHTENDAGKMKQSLKELDAIIAEMD